MGDPLMLRDSTELIMENQRIAQLKSEIESETFALREFMQSSQGWGREQGRMVYSQLLNFVESKAGVLIFHVSMKGVERTDISFASETIVELARRYRSTKGFALVDLSDSDMLENWDAAASRKDQPLIVLRNNGYELIGPKPSEGTDEAFRFAMRHSSVRAAQFASSINVSIANASMKFKQLWERGFLLRREAVAESGGIEFVYQPIG